MSCQAECASTDERYKAFLLGVLIVPLAQCHS